MADRERPQTEPTVADLAAAWGLHPVQGVLMEFDNCYEDVVSYVRGLPSEWTEGGGSYAGSP